VLWDGASVSAFVRVALTNSYLVVCFVVGTPFRTLFVSSEVCEVGDDVQSDQVRECRPHAEDCAQQAASQIDPKLRRDYLIIGAYWLKLSQELSERPLP
jgi:hypothetical protein